MEGKLDFNNHLIFMLCLTTFLLQTETIFTIRRTVGRLVVLHRNHVFPVPFLECLSYRLDRLPSTTKGPEFVDTRFEEARTGD